MRSFIYASIIGITTIIGSIFYTRHIENISTEMLSCNQVIYQLIENDEYSAADKNIEKLINYIDMQKPILAATGNHEEIDKIEINISELRQYNKYMYKVDALTKSKVLNVLFEHLPKNYKLCPENIL